MAEGFTGQLYNLFRKIIPGRGTTEKPGSNITMQKTNQRPQNYIWNQTYTTLETYLDYDKEKEEEFHSTGVGQLKPIINTDSSDITSTQLNHDIITSFTTLQTDTVEPPEQNGDDACITHTLNRAYIDIGKIPTKQIDLNNTLVLNRNKPSQNHNSSPTTQEI